MPKQYLEIKIFGKVQRVFFRAKTKKMADDLRIKGFVRNETDGSVFIRAEGEEKNMRQFLANLETISKLAEVNEIKIQKTKFGNFNKFEIYD